MMLAETERLLASCAKALIVADAADCARAITGLAGILRRHGHESMTTLVDRWTASTRKQTPTRSKPARGLQVGTLKACLLQFHQMLTAGKAENKCISDLVLLTQLIEAQDESGSVPDFLKRLDTAMMMQVIADFVERLKRDRGTKAFERTFEELKTSPLKAEQVVQVATAVVGPIPRSTSRSEALKVIRQPHDAEISAKRGIEATGGRSAA